MLLWMYTIAMVISMYLLMGCCSGDCYHDNSYYDNTHVVAEVIVSMVTHMLMLFCMDYIAF